MKKLFFITLILNFISTFSFGQKTSNDNYNLDFTKSKFYKLKISQKIDTPYLKLSCNNNVIFYVPINQLKSALESNKLYQISKEKAVSQNFKNHIVKLIDSLYDKQKLDSTLTYGCLGQLQTYFRDLMIKGRVHIFLKDKNKFIDTITYRVERYATMFERVYYYETDKPFWIDLVVDKPEFFEQIKFKSKNEQIVFWNGLKESGKLHNKCMGL